PYPSELLWNRAPIASGARPRANSFRAKARSTALARSAVHRRNRTNRHAPPIFSWQARPPRARLLRLPDVVRPRCKWADRSAPGHQGHTWPRFRNRLSQHQLARNSLPGACEKEFLPQTIWPRPIGRRLAFPDRFRAGDPPDLAAARLSLHLRF